LYHSGESFEKQKVRTAEKTNDKSRIFIRSAKNVKLKKQHRFTIGEAGS
jgi:hypothetical protein